jgi:hypothetical protein
VVVVKPVSWYLRFEDAYLSTGGGVKGTLVDNIPVVDEQHFLVNDVPFSGVGVDGREGNNLVYLREFNRVYLVGLLVKLEDALRFYHVKKPAKNKDVVDRCAGVAYLAGTDKHFQVLTTQDSAYRDGICPGPLVDILDGCHIVQPEDIPAVGYG